MDGSVVVIASSAHAGTIVQTYYVVLVLLCDSYNDNDFSTTRTMRTALATARRLTASRAPTHAPIATTACTHWGIGLGLASLSLTGGGPLGARGCDSGSPEGSM